MRVLPCASGGVPSNDEGRLNRSYFPRLGGVVTFPALVDLFFSSGSWIQDSECPDTGFHLMRNPNDGPERRYLLDFLFS